MTRERLGCVNTIVPVGRDNLKAKKFYVDWRRSPAVVPELEAVGEIGKAVQRWSVGGAEEGVGDKEQKEEVAGTWGKGKL